MMHVPATFQQRSRSEEKKYFINQARSRRSRRSSYPARMCVRDTKLHTHIFSRAHTYKSPGTSGTSGTQLISLENNFCSAGTHLERIWNEAMTKKNLREDMPTIAKLIDVMREVFGKEPINNMIRAGLDGQPVFWARENGIEIGTRPLGAQETRQHAGNSEK